MNLLKESILTGVTYSSEAEVVFLEVCARADDMHWTPVQFLSILNIQRIAT